MLIRSRLDLRAANGTDVDMGCPEEIRSQGGRHHSLGRSQDCDTRYVPSICIFGGDCRGLPFELR